MKKKFSYFIFLSFFLGCNGQLYVETTETSQDVKDLDQFLNRSDLSSEVEEPNIEVVEEPSVDVDVTVEVEEEPEPLKDPCENEIPEWTQELHREIQGEHKGKAHRFNSSDQEDFENSSERRRRGGKRKRKTRGVNSDLIRSDCEPNEKEDTLDKMAAETQTETAEETQSIEQTPQEEQVSKISKATNKLDILMVIDNSASMNSLLKSNNIRFDGFIDNFKKLNWRIAFLDSDPEKNGNKKLMELELDGSMVLSRRYITKHTRKNQQIFIDTITRNNKPPCLFSPGCGSPVERTMTSLSQYLAFSEEPETGSHFLRDDASLAVVIMTDNKENESQDQLTTANLFLHDLDESFKDKGFTVYSITALSSECQQQLRRRGEPSSLEANFAPEITSLASQTDGANISLCSPSYSIVGNSITQDHLKEIS